MVINTSTTKGVRYINANPKFPALGQAVAFAMAKQNTTDNNARSSHTKKLKKGYRV
jgi:hypothetical protein